MRPLQMYELARAWGDMLDKKGWSAFCTFTYHRKMTLKSGRLKMETMFKKLHGKYGNTTEGFWILEPFVDRTSYHVHAFVKINESSELLSSSILKMWHAVAGPAGYRKYSRALILPYEAGKGAHYYITKHIGKEYVDYDLFP